MLCVKHLLDQHVHVRFTECGTSTAHQAELSSDQFACEGEMRNFMCPSRAFF